MHERILGIEFFNGTPAAAVERMISETGCVVIPASPALLNLKHDPAYRDALQRADLVLPDSALLTILWKQLGGRRLRKISGLEYLRCLLKKPPFSGKEPVLWVLPSEAAKERTLQMLHDRDCRGDGHRFFIVAGGAAPKPDHTLLLQIDEEKPRHVVLALPGCEPMGIYLRDYLLFRPSLHCVGSSLAMLTGEEGSIPQAFERLGVGWLARLRSQPRMLLPRLGIALAVASMIFRYRAELPPLTPRWADV